MAIPPAAQVLRNAEVEIAKLATTAAGERDYDGAERLLGIARQLGVTAEKLIAAAESVVSGVAAKQAAFVPTPVVSEPTGELPRFERDGNELVKLGKSKSDNKIYEHRASRQILDDLLAAIRTSANKKGEFRSDRILPIASSAGGDVPAYQSYLCLAWLRQVGVIERVARQRYRFAPDMDMLASVDAAWQALNAR